MSLSLYDITESILALREMLDDESGWEINEQDINEQLDQYLGSLLPEKVSNYAALMRELSLTIDAFREEEVRIAEKRKAMSRAKDKMQGRLLEMMRSLDVKRVEAGTFTVTRQASSPSVSIIDNDALPQEYMTVTVKASKASIKRDLLDGKSVPGATLVESDHVRIK